MRMHPHYRHQARFASQLRRRSREMMAGRHCESNSWAMLLASIHIAQLAHLLALTERRLAAAEQRKDAA